MKTIFAAIITALFATITYAVPSSDETTARGSDNRARDCAVRPHLPKCAKQR